MDHQFTHRLLRKYNLQMQSV